MKEVQVYNLRVTQLNAVNKCIKKKNTAILLSMDTGLSFFFDYSQKLYICMRM